MVGAKNFPGAGRGVLYQLGIIDQHGISFYDFNGCGNTEGLRHTFDQFLKTFCDLYADIRLQGSECALQDGFFRDDV